TFVPPGLPTNLYGAGQSVLNSLVWAKVLAQGEIIKFLHHAIEWENMLYFLYPYFWSHTSRWEFKKYLDHPDFMHRSFLKAGSARVVLTIRPGFERDFVSFVETGSLTGLPAGHPYLTIAEEMQEFAKTNYPGIRPANPTESSRPLLSPLQKRAWRDMEGIIALLEQYRTANGVYPTTAQGLTALGSLGAVPAADPWGRPFVYRSPGLLTDFELETLGADGLPGGEGDDADVTSWAEASLIGRWYDYTPTSALDIAFNETMPTA
ncbi:MAG TPA: type II secretion system protein GspG, partial [Burkholderiales bacterium]|nr:type II secretion system protein GspG [Burkholderiales bacterium]